jgi:hypothetical protein
MGGGPVWEAKEYVPDFSVQFLKKRGEFKQSEVLSGGAEGEVRKGAARWTIESESLYFC